MTFKKALMGAVFLGAAAAMTACSGGGGGGAGSPVAPLPPPPAPPPPPPPPPPPASDFETPEYFGSSQGSANIRTGLDLLNASSAYAEGATGEGIIVAVVDTGVNSSHPELSGKLTSTSIDIAGDRGFDDLDGHGTGVAGVLAANRDGAVMHGIAFDSRIMAIRADTPGSCEVDDGEGCTFSDLNTARAIDHAVANGANVINLSLGRDAELGDGATLTFAAMRRAADAGVLMVVSSGNQDEEEDVPDPSPGFPASFASDPDADGFVVAVGSVDFNGVISNFSNRAQGAENFFLVAPGESILTPFADDENGEPQYVLFSGTSFAAPYVAGALALLLDGFPNLSGADALSILFDTAVDLGDPGPDAIYGRGLVDLEAAFQPVGTSSVQMGAAQSATPLAVVLSAPSGPYGDWLWQSSLLDGAILRDGYERAFDFSPEAPRTPAHDSTLSAMESAAEGGLSQTFQVNAGPASIDMRLTPDRPRALSNLPAETYQSEPDMSFAVRQGGLTVQAGRGFTSPAPAGSAGGSVLSRTAFSGAVAGFAAQRDWASVRYEHNQLAVQLRMSGAGDSAFQAAAATYDLGAQSIGFEVGSGAETGTAMGGRLAYRFGARDEAQSRFAALVWTGALPLGWNGAGRIEQVTADLALPGAMEMGDAMRASAWTIGADRALAGGRFGLTLAQPLRTESGSITALVPTGLDEDYRTTFEQRTAALTPSGREISMEASWRVALNPRTTASLAARVTREPGHLRQADDEGLIWAGFRTRW